GASYKLIARTKQGDRMLAGTVLTSAPNVRVLIPIREDLANASTPPIPNTPGAKDPPPAQGEGKNNGGATDWSAGHTTSPATKGPIETPTLNVPSQPTNTPVANPAPGAGSPNFVPGIADGP